MAFVGGKKQMGHVYADRGSCSRSGGGALGGSCPWDLGFGLDRREGFVGAGSVDDDEEAATEVEGAGVCSMLTGCKIFARLGLLTELLLGAKIPISVKDPTALVD